MICDICGKTLPYIKVIQLHPVFVQINGLINYFHKRDLSFHISCFKKNFIHRKENGYESESMCRVCRKDVYGASSILTTDHTTEGKRNTYHT